MAQTRTKLNEKEKIRRKIGNTRELKIIKEDRRGKDNHASRKKKKPYNKTEHFSKQRDKDSLEKSYFKSGKVHQRAEFPLQFLQ